MQEFINELREDIFNAIQIHRVYDFSSFLKSLNKDRLEKYYELMVLYNEDSEDLDGIILQKAIIFYSTIILYIEDPNPENKVQIDGEGDWLIRLLYFLGLEKMRRENIVGDFEGRLISGKVNQKMGPNFLPYVRHISNLITKEERDRYTKLYGEDFWKKMEED